MSRSWSGRLSRRPQDQAAQAAQDGAVAAFLDLDTRQSYVSDGIDAAGESSTGGSSLTREWTPVKQAAFEASAKYLAAAESYSLLDVADHPTGVDPALAQTAFVEVHRILADAAVAVDTFYRRHAQVLEQARSLRAATPKISADARTAAVQAESELTGAERDGVAYPSVMTAAGVLVEALSALKTADTIGSPLEIRSAAAAVHAAAHAVSEKVDRARTLPATVRSSLSSVRTRVEAATTKLAALPANRSALLREFSADCSKDLDGADDRARRALDHAKQELAAAEQAQRAGQLEAAFEHLTTARAQLGSAEADEKSLAERLSVLRATKADPVAAAKTTRFKVRDAQLLVVDRGLVQQWGSVLDAQSQRVERAAAELVGTHPNYWAYLQALQSVEAFVKTIVDRVRAQAR